MNKLDINCMFSWLKEGIITALAVIASVIAPIKSALIVLFICALFNFIVGWKTDTKVYKQGFCLSKAMRSLEILLFWAVTTLVIHNVIFVFGEVNLAFAFIKYLTWIVAYWYLVNVLKNAKQLYPKNQAIHFLHDLATVEMLNVLKMKFMGTIKDHKPKDKDLEK